MALFEAGPQGAGQPHRGVKFEVDAVDHFVIRLIGKNPAFCRAGGMDEYIATAKTLEAGPDRRIATFFRAQVVGMKVDLGRAAGPQVVDGGAKPLTIRCRQEYPCAFAGQTLGAG